MIYLTVMLFIALVGFGIWVVVHPLMHTQEGKMKVLMFGRSTMSLWFKHWNWPYPLRLKTTYKPWPIPYKEYSQGKLYLKYFSVDGPERSKTGDQFGDKMLKSVQAGLDSGKFEAAFFKFCFVDFPVQGNEEKEKRLKDLKDVVIRIHDMTSKMKMKLIIGNALPLPNPNNETLSLQKDDNIWLQGYASQNKDILVFDLFGPITDQDGRLILDYIQAKGDYHPGDKAYKLFDKTFFPQVEGWLLQER